jgi:very-short-patch-repair endonuclease
MKIFTKNILNQAKTLSNKKAQLLITVPLIMDEDLHDIKFEVEHAITGEGGTFDRLDLYLPQFKLNFEIDEYHHNSELNDHLDKERQTFIEKEHGITFSRHSASENTDFPAVVRTIKDKILSCKNEQIEKNIFKPFYQFYEMDNALNDNPNAIFRFIRNENESKKEIYNANKEKLIKAKEIINLDYLTKEYVNSVKNPVFETRGNYTAIIGGEIKNDNSMKISGGTFNQATNSIFYGKGLT